MAISLSRLLTSRFMIWVGISGLALTTFCILHFYIFQYREIPVRPQINESKWMPDEQRFNGFVYDTSLWRKLYGKYEPDPKTENEQERLINELRVIHSVCPAFHRWLWRIPNAYTNVNHDVDGFLAMGLDMLEGHCREVCKNMLMPVHLLNGTLRIRDKLSALKSEHERVVAIGHFYHINCKLADWFWSKAGDPFAAAKIDYGIIYELRCLRGMGKDRHWSDVVEVVDDYIEKWTQERFDPETSNFALAYSEGEKLYRLNVSDNPEVNRLLFGELDCLYRSKLKNVCSRMLGRCPRWAPDFVKIAPGQQKVENMQ